MKQCPCTEVQEHAYGIPGREAVPAMAVVRAAGLQITGERKIESGEIGGRDTGRHPRL
jgi:hypothetical protein